MAIMLLPACYGVLMSFCAIARHFVSVPEGSFYFFSGFLGYMAFQWVFFKPIRTYVFGHELTHALAAWMSGGDVEKFHVSKKGGSVTVTKTNIFVALAPYMIPLYSLVLLGLFYLGCYFYNLQPYRQWFLLILGMSIGFHAALTWHALKNDQPDLQSAGVLLSGVFIYLGNVLCLIFLLGLLFPKTVSWKEFFKTSGRESWTAYRQVCRGGVHLATLSQKWIHKSSSEAGMRNEEGGRCLMKKNILPHSELRTPNSKQQ